MGKGRFKGHFSSNATVSSGTLRVTHILSAAHSHLVRRESTLTVTFTPGTTCQPLTWMT